MALRIKSDDSLLFIVDIQQKLAPAMFAGEVAISNNYKLLQAALHLKLPYLVSEQYSKGIGHTVEMLSALIDPINVIEKMTFSCLDEPVILDRLQQQGRRQIIVTGMECHVCVLQTVLDLLDAGYQVFVVDDCVASRTPENRMLGIERMRQNGAQIVSREMVMFEWLNRAGTDEFKAILPLIK
jgi:isochorismatase family protein